MSLGAAELLGLFGHFMLLSLLAIGGAISTVPEMHRYVVVQQQWLDDAAFTASIALAQAAPGPNLLFVAVLGYNIAGLTGAAVTMLASVLPSTTLVLCVTRWGQRRAEARGVRAFKAGLAPVTVGLLLSTGWILSEPSRDSLGAMGLIALTVAAALLTRLSPMWLVAAGAVAGALGWV
ncbi:chromate transporter [Caldimonas tepidiphila]|uniref:chromate transporter n=1 Tax=Caldimonas tepidiphila TaxID=2315841 RepID=UPI000E5AD3A2|nr:chromate transporter [Caldimonas tepidiphila]